MLPSRLSLFRYNDGSIRGGRGILGDATAAGVDMIHVRSGVAGVPRPPVFSVAPLPAATAGVAPPLLPELVAALPRFGQARGTSWRFPHSVSSLKCV